MRTAATTSGSMPPKAKRARQPPNAGTGMMYPAQECRERAAERDADDRQRDGERPVSPRNVLGGERRGVGHRAAKPESREKAQRTESPQALDERDRGGQDTEDEDAADEREATAHPIADEAGERAADHHADHAAREHRPELCARHRPIPHHRGDGDAQQLVVDAIEDDRERRQEYEDLLPTAPAPLVEHVADVDRLSTWHARSLWRQVLDFTIRVVQIARPNGEIQDLTP